MGRIRTVPSHNHVTRDIKQLGHCPSCDDYWERQGLTTDQVEDAIYNALIAHQGPEDVLRLLVMMSKVNKPRYLEMVDMFNDDEGESGGEV